MLQRLNDDTGSSTLTVTCSTTGSPAEDSTLLLATTCRIAGASPDNPPAVNGVDAALGASAGLGHGLSCGGLPRASSVPEVTSSQTATRNQFGDNRSVTVRSTIMAAMIALNQPSHAALHGPASPRRRRRTRSAPSVSKRRREALR